MLCLIYELSGRNDLKFCELWICCYWKLRKPKIVLFSISTLQRLVKVFKVFIIAVLICHSVRNSIQIHCRLNLNESIKCLQVELMIIYIVKCDVTTSWCSFQSTQIHTCNFEYLSQHKPYLPRNPIAHHSTPKMIFRSVIFSTPRSGKFIHNYIWIAHLEHTWISWEVI